MYSQDAYTIGFKQTIPVYQDRLPDAYTSRGLLGDYYSALPRFKPDDHRDRSQVGQLSDLDLSIYPDMYGKRKRPFYADRWSPWIWFFNDHEKLMKYDDVGPINFYAWYIWNSVDAYAMVESYNYYVENYYTPELESIQKEDHDLYLFMENIYVQNYEFWLQAPILYIGYPLAILAYILILRIGYRALLIVLTIFFAPFVALGILDPDKPKKKERPDECTLADYE